MEFEHFVASEDDSGRRLDRVVKRIIPQGNCPKLDQTMRKGLIKLNEKKCSGQDRISPGDRISIAAFLLKTPEDTRNEPESCNPQADKKHPQFPKLEDVFKNQYIRIINKPYGISSQPSSGETLDLSKIVQEEYQAEHPDQSLSFRTGPLHRLDKNTTGLLAFSQNSQGARYFSENISSHTIKKTYIGIVQGKLMGNCTWEDVIIQDPISVENSGDKSSKFHTVTVISMDSLDSQKGKKAITTAIPLAYGWLNNKAVTLVQFNIKTGRKHQIRSQSAFHGLPLCGDKAYGAKPISASREFFLHAIRLDFPKNNEAEIPDHIQAPLHQDFLDFIKLCLINWDGELII